MKLRPLTLCVVLGIAFLGCPLFAQQDQGAIWGQVTDQTGAVVPNADVTLTNLGTSQTRTGTTGADGAFVFTLLPIGNYQAEVSASGFKLEKRSGLQLHVQERLEADFKLEVGSATQKIEVTSTAPPLQTAEASLGRWWTKGRLSISRSMGATFINSWC